MINEDKERYIKYVLFYFKNKYKLSDIHTTDMLMLHNSWTPYWYKQKTLKDIREDNCTLSNILNELTK